MEAKVEQQADFDFCCAEIVQELRFVSRFETSSCFQLEQHFVFYENVAKVRPYLLAAKPHWDGHLTGNVQSAILKSQHHRCGVS